MSIFYTKSLSYSEKYSHKNTFNELSEIIFIKIIEIKHRYKCIFILICYLSINIIKSNTYA